MAISYRESLYRDYQSSLDEALRQVGMRERLAGKPLSLAERASIIQGILMPYSSQYAGGLEAEAARAQEQERMDMQRDALKQQQEADKMAGYTQLASLGLMGTQYYMRTSGANTAATPAAGGGAGAGTTTGTTAGGGAGAETGMAPHGAYAESGSGTTTAGTGSGGTKPYGQGAGAGTGSTSWWTTEGRYGGQWYGPYVGFASGVGAGYAASPYGQQAEEGTGGLSRYPYKPIGGILGGGSRRTGQRLGMVSVGAGAGTLAGGWPYGTAGGFVGGYLQENPETGKRGYQEDWEYRIKPMYEKGIEPVTHSRFTSNLTKPLKKVKKFFS